ncbi:hypothetical protein PF010_g18415 [Phytophthora fragariae]|uniref:Uncharacterized protein n=2 Tax=Phytophthora fragariae TaxID=53985 RepID=A0A6G0KK79_9STRA|nr:hypothetical protein PF010_g18415 [Phytophthora fragariae]
MRKNKSRCVTTECLLIMAARYEPDFRAGRTRQAAIMYLHRFRRRNRLSVRRITHRGTKQRDEMEYYVEESGTVAHLNGLDKFSCVYNMDQTAVYIDMNPSTTIDFAGARHVDVVQGMSENSFRASVFLCASATGHKLPPMIIFAGVGYSGRRAAVPLYLPQWGVPDPMDQGVIAMLKVMDAQTEAIMQAYMHGSEDPHQIKLAQTLQWCKQAWDDIPDDTIKH